MVHMVVMGTGCGMSQPFQPKQDLLILFLVTIVFFM